MFEVGKKYKTKGSVAGKCQVIAICKDGRLIVQTSSTRAHIHNPDGTFPGGATLNLIPRRTVTDQEAREIYRQNFLKDKDVPFCLWENRSDQFRASFIASLEDIIYHLE